MNGICKSCQGRNRCNCGCESPDFTFADHVINVICAAVLVWVLWEATKGLV